jgi:hypothetical protein
MVDGHGMLTNDLHILSLSSCELHANSLTLFKDVTEVLFVWVMIAVPYDKISKKPNIRMS